MRILGFVPFALLFASLPAAAAASGSSISLSWNDASGLVPDDGEGVRQEVEAIFEESGVEVRWVASSPLIVVITPSEPSGRGWNLAPSAMGVHLKGVGSSAVFVFYRRVARTLGLPSRNERLLSLREQRDVSRALARVVVHELLHRLAPSLPHAETGIMRAHLDARALTRARLPIDASSRAALLARLMLRTSVAP